MATTALTDGTASTFHPQVYRRVTAVSAQHPSLPASSTSVSSSPSRTRHDDRRRASDSSSGSGSSSDDSRSSESCRPSGSVATSDCSSVCSADSPRNSSEGFASDAADQHGPCQGLQHQARDYPLHPASTHDCSFRLITASQYADLVFQHDTTKISHDVLFPWLHGADFAGSMQAANFGYYDGAVAPTPRYRGLTTIAAPSDHAATDDGSSRPHIRQSTTASIASTLSTDTLASTGTTASCSSHSSSSLSSSSIFDSSSDPSCSSASSVDLASPSKAEDDAGPSAQQDVSQIEHDDYAEDMRPWGPEARSCLLSNAWSPDQIFAAGTNKFIKPSLPAGINFRHYRMQGPKYASISDVVVYGEHGGFTSEVIATARRAKLAVLETYRERMAEWKRTQYARGEDEDLASAPLRYEVYVVVEPFQVIERRYTHLVDVDSKGWPTMSKLDFAERELAEMKNFTQATEIAENIWLGNSYDVPWPRDGTASSADVDNVSANPNAYSICIEARDTAYMANARELFEREIYLGEMQAKRDFEAKQHHLLVAQQQRLARAESVKQQRESVPKCMSRAASTDSCWYSSSSEESFSPSCSSASSSECGDPEHGQTSDFDEDSLDYNRAGSDREDEFVDAEEGDFNDDVTMSLSAISAAIPDAEELDLGAAAAASRRPNFKRSKSLAAAKRARQAATRRSFSTVTSVTISPSTSVASTGCSADSKPADSSNSNPGVLQLTPEEILHLEAFSTGQTQPHPAARTNMVDAILEHCIWLRMQARPSLRTSVEARGGLKHLRQDAPTAIPLPRRVLIHCQDGYTDSSVLALAYTMYDRACTLPEAYLNLQLAKKRSFFVYPSDVPLLRVVEQRVLSIARSQDRLLYNDDLSPAEIAVIEARQASEAAIEADRQAKVLAESRNSTPTTAPQAGGVRGFLSRPSIFGRSSSANSSSASINMRTPTPTSPTGSRAGSPTASANAAAPVQHAWFHDERFDGHFPSRILDHVYLGNLNHAGNALMLKELGITHVLSIGETALIPPNRQSASIFPSTAMKARTPTNSLWLEQSLGNIEVLDIQDIQDDGVDPILPHLLTAIEFIESAHAKGGKVLVHCRVGVSRSATLVIAYVMKFLDLSLADAYLMVRARRLNILIQPTILFMWTLHMYEEEIRESGFDEQAQLVKERSGRMSWPVLATEMANLNAKYLGC